MVPGNSFMIPYTVHVSSGVFEIKILPRSQLTRQPPLVNRLNRFYESRFESNNF